MPIFVARQWIRHRTARRNEISGRINLPLSSYTEWYWQMVLKNRFHFLALRMDSHAQWEIQEYGRAMAEIVKAVCPLEGRRLEKFEGKLNK